MKITCIDIRNFRRLRQPVTLDGLDGGITVICGDNEEGKSTILKAVQCAFFDRHSLSGEKADDMLPYGAGGVAPRVEVAFTFDGRPCRLVKTFRPQPGATLDIGGRSLEDDAVEERLREMLRFSPRGKGAARADNRGLWSLFWVEQGTAFGPLDLNDDARASLDETLQSQVGKVLGGKRGERLVEALEARYREHFTPQGRPRGSVKSLGESAEALDAKLAEARAALAAFESKSSQLAAIEARIAERARDGLEARRIAAVKIAKADLAKIETFRHRVEKAKNDLKHAQRDAEKAKESWSRRREQLSRLAELRDDIVKDEAKATETGRGRATAGKRRDEALARVTAAEAELTAAAQAVTGARNAIERGSLANQLSDAKKRLASAEAAAAAVTEAEAEAGTLGIDEKIWKKLETLEKRASLARTQFESAAAAIVFMPDKAQSVHRDGAAVPAGTPVVLTSTALFALDGFGAVEVRPGGGEDIGDLRNAQEKASQAMAKALADIGAPTLDEAAQRHARWKTLTDKANSERIKLGGIVPDGLDALRTRVAQDAARLAALGGESGGDAAALDTARTEAEAAHTRCERADKAARKELKDADDAFSEAREEHGRAETRLEARRAENMRVSREIEAERAQTDDATLDRLLADTKHEADAAETRLAAEQDALDRAEPEAAELKHANAESALAELQKSIREDEDNRLQLRSELNTLGARGLGEEVAELEGERTRLAAKLAAAEREAKAIRLLRDTLSAKEKEARENFTGPVRARIAPYLKLLFPGTEIGIDDTSFAIDHFHRSEVQEKFDALSLGTREQIAVLVRLAFAEYLADHGEPPVVILDDALVNADPGRMQRMLLALRKASQTLQIIVLTCDEARYAPLGAPIVRLAEARAAA
jgi:DNA repair exonuclease SbcCD ATPase subunit